MIDHEAFSVEPWAVRQVRFSPELLAQAESLFALSNGHLGLRGNLDEGEPSFVHGTYLNGFYERRPLPYAERGPGDPETTEVVINVTDGKRLHLLVDGEELDVRTGEVLLQERCLDLRSGVLERDLQWRSPAGATVRVRSRRLVSLVHPELAAIEYEVEALGRPVTLIVHSDLTADATNPPSRDPRSGVELSAATLRPQLARASDRRVVLVHETAESRLRLAAGMDHTVTLEGDDPAESCHCVDELGRLTVSVRAEPGRPLRLVKYLAYRWSGSAAVEALEADADVSLDMAFDLGFERLESAQRALLDGFWADADIELDGDPEVQQALRFSLFHLFQASFHASGRAIPAKGLTGQGYSGHAFWDTESFVLPVLMYIAPRLARDALRWRAATLGLARTRAHELGLRGAAFAWRTITGRECSGYMPAGTAAFHVNADVADAMSRFAAASGDEDFLRDVAAPVLVETARLWLSLGFRDPAGRFCLHGVTGPDEYSVLVDNNLYTNLMAQANLRAAADAADRLGPEAVGAGADEVSAWRAAADAMAIPYDERLGIHLQDEDFARRERWDFAATAPEHYPLLLHYPAVHLYRRQVVKQPDLVLAMHLRAEVFSAEQKRRNLAFYEPLTVRDSSLSAGTNAVVAAEAGHLELARDYLEEATLTDLHDLHRNTTDGLHLAALAGGWIATVAGLAGLRDHGGTLSFAPRLPRRYSRLAFAVQFRGRRLRVTVTGPAACYTLLEGDPLDLAHHGEPVHVTRAQPVTCPVPPLPSPGEPPRQPLGRAPQRPLRSD